MFSSFFKFVLLISYVHFNRLQFLTFSSSKLVPWLNLIFTCKQLVKEFYLPWSYVAKTGKTSIYKSVSVMFFCSAFHTLFSIFCFWLLFPLSFAYASHPLLLFVPIYLPLPFCQLISSFKLNITI